MGLFHFLVPAQRHSVIRAQTLTFLVLLLAGCSTATRNPIGETGNCGSGRDALQNDHRVSEVSAHCCSVEPYQGLFFC
jgi:hypothetical protein